MYNWRGGEELREAVEDKFFVKVLSKQRLSMRQKELHNAFFFLIGLICELFKMTKQLTNRQTMRGEHERDHTKGGGRPRQL